MMGVTHRPTGAAWWLGTVLVANAAGAGVNPVVAGAGALIAPVFAAGRLSPDADVTWLARLGHRQATHRPRTAVALTVVTLAVWLPVVWLVDSPATVLVWAPVAGWWSHLAGDAVFGRIPVGRRTGDVLSMVVPGRVLRRSGGRQAWWFGLGFDTDGLLERGTRRTSEVTSSGLHRTVKVLPFPPMTLLMQAAVVVLMVAVVWQASGGRAS